MDVNAKLLEMIQEADRIKKQYQAGIAYFKTSKPKKFLETAAAMVGDTVSMYSYQCSGDMVVSITVKSLEGFKDERFMAILSAFDYLNPTSTNMSENGTALSKQVRYDFPGAVDNGVTLTEVRVYVEGYVKSDSETCRREVIGMTEPKPQPIYKIVCDDASVESLTGEQQ